MFVSTPLDKTDPNVLHTHICAADVQDHEAELEVLVLVQLVHQLPVVSLWQNTSNPKGSRSCSTILLFFVGPCR